MELVAKMAEMPAGAASRSRKGGVEAGSRAEAGAAKDRLAPGDIPGATDDLLVRAAVTGQREAYNELVRRYTNMVLWFTNARLRDPLEAEEVTQQAFVTAYVELPRLRAARAFPNWLFTIANSIISKSRRRESRLIRLDGAPPSVEADAGPGPAQILSDEEMRERLTREIEKLPPHYRVALAMKYLNGCSVDQIAARIQVPEGTVRARLSRAYGMLRSRLEPAMLGEKERAQTEPGGPTAADG